MPDLTKDDLRAQINERYDQLITLIKSLSEVQRAATDANGWTICDHAINIAQWESVAFAPFDGESKRELLAVPVEAWEGGEDAINAVIQQRHQDMSHDDVLQLLQQTHTSTLSRLDALIEAELQRPYNHYRAESDYDFSMSHVLQNDIVYHYDEHMPWVIAIAESA